MSDNRNRLFACETTYLKYFVRADVERQSHNQE